MRIPDGVVNELEWHRLYHGDAPAEDDASVSEAAVPKPQAEQARKRTQEAK